MSASSWLNVIWIAAGADGTVALAGGVELTYCACAETTPTPIPRLQESASNAAATKRKRLRKIMFETSWSASDRWLVEVSGAGRCESWHAGCAVDGEVELAFGIVHDVGASHDDFGVPGAWHRDLVAVQGPASVAGWRRIEQVLAEVRSVQPNAYALNSRG